jgi:uncharacterized protein YyaL (SSP411 family)
MRGQAKQLAIWRETLQQYYLPHHLIVYLDEKISELPPSLHRTLESDVNAWVCKGVTCSPSTNNLQQLIKNLL